MDAEIEEEEEEPERNRQGRCLDSQLDLFLLGCIRTTKNTCIYRAFDRNRPIETIDGYDETVHDGPFRLSRGRRIVMDGHDLFK